MEWDDGNAPSDRSALTLLDSWTRKPALVLGVGRWTTWMAGCEIQKQSKGTRVEGVGM